MTLPDLPPEGSIDWYDHYAALDAQARAATAIFASKTEVARTGSMRRAQRALFADPATFKVLLLGDSQATRANYTQQYVQFEKHMQPGGALAGMLPANLIDGGNPGLNPTTWLTPTNGVDNGVFTKTMFEANASTLKAIVLEFNGMNSLRLAGTQAAFEAEMRTLLAYLVLHAPQADILLPTAPPLTTTVVGQDYLAGATLAQAQARADAMRQGVLALTGEYPQLLVVDMGADVFGTEVKATSPLMTDQLHWNSLGQRRAADYLVSHLAPRLRRQTSVASTGTRYLRVGTVVTATNGSITVAAFDELGLPASEWTPSASDTLHIPRFGTTGTVALSGTAFIPSAANLTLSKAGTDFSTVVVGSLVAITGDHAMEGVQGGRLLATVDPASIAAGATLDVNVTVTGALFHASRPQMAVMVQPGVALGGLQLSWRISADNTVTLSLHNPTGAAIDLASSSWGFWLVR